LRTAWTSFRVGAIACAIAGSSLAGSLGAGCSSSSDGGAPTTNSGPDASTGPRGDAAGPGDGASGPEAAAGSPADGGDAAMPSCFTPSTPGSCAAPEMTALPICTLSLTGCMDSTTLTSFVAKAIRYEVNSPLWSDGAAKSRAFVLPPGGKIHVKDCEPDAGATALADCTSPMGIPNGAADTGRWVFPVGTVMLKNFVFDGKVVETRLLMRVDAATAAVIQNGTDWVGYNYAWNEAQTEATVVPNARTSVRFDTGKRTVTWNYPNFADCIGCHNPAVGTLGPENDQMNRVVDGGNQLDTFVAMGLFDTTAPRKPYAAALVEPYASADLGLAGPPAGATVDQEARSYLSANCGFCHRPDVNDQGFDLRAGLSLAQTGICGLAQQNGIPGMASADLADLAPGDHAHSAMWIRMNTPVPASDPDETSDVGRMPPVSSFVVDTQATALIGQWIDAIKSCPGADAGH
jgi:hypothetical protein